MGDSDILSNRPRFNRPTHDYIFTGSQFRGGNDLSFVRFSKGTNSIDICNSGIDISSSTVNIFGNASIGGNLNINGSTTFSSIGGTNLNITGDTSLNNVYISGTTLKVPSTFMIDPAAHGTNTGLLQINGNLQVLGTTTTINSSVVDISDKMIVLASNSLTSAQADGAGFEISGANVRFIYNDANTRFQSSIGIGISGNLLPIYNDSQVPVSFNTYKLVNTGLGDHLGTTHADWETPSGYDISKVVLSRHSYIKMEFKVNFISSTEAEQTLGFRVQRSIDGGSTYNTTPIFTDPSLGSNMGIGFINVYNGTYIDNLNGASLTNNETVYYRLQIKRNLPAFDSEISTPYGIIGTGVGNYIFLQELYRPSA